MTRALCILYIFLPLFSSAQMGEMRVYTVAGDTNMVTSLGDGGPATSAGMGETEGVWMDGNCNLYFTDDAHKSIRKVNLESGIITTVAGSSNGFSGDGGQATNAQLRPYGIYVNSIGDIYIADAGNNRVRRVDALTGIIETIAGGGAILGDNGPATNAQLNDPGNVYLDLAGNVYIGESARIRKINSSGIITTIAGTGVAGLSGDGGPATNAQIDYVQTMLFDTMGNLVFADRGNSRLRKINSSTNIITTIAGSSGGFSGDGGPATDAQFNGIISFVIDKYGNILIGDNGNNYLRKIDAITNVVMTIAGMGPAGVGSRVDGALATSTKIHPEFMYLDLDGNIYFSNWADGQVRKVTNYNAGFRGETVTCNIKSENSIVKNEHSSFIEIYPNPVSDVLTIKDSELPCDVIITNMIGQIVIHKHIDALNTYIDTKILQPGQYIAYFVNSTNLIVNKLTKI